MKDFEENLSTLLRDGYVLLPDVVSVQTCDELKILFEELFEKLSPLYINSQKKTSHGLNDKSFEKIVYNLHNKDLRLLEYLDHPAIFPIVDAALKVGSYQNAEPIAHLNSAARSPLPGAKEQQLHIDSRIKGAHVPVCLQVVWMLENFTRENGATRVVPGSQRLTEYPENGKIYDNEDRIVGKKGSVAIFDANLWHGAGANATESSRWGMILTYGRWFMKPSFSIIENTPKEVFDKCSDRQKELLGFRFKEPRDEFTRLSRRSTEFEKPTDYKLPL